MASNLVFKKYQVALTGVTPLIMHADNIDWQDKINKWRKAPMNKSLSVAGDDRSPAFTWIGYLYRSLDKSRIVMPSDNVLTCLREGGTKVRIGTGRKSFKVLTQSSIIFSDFELKFTVRGKEVFLNTISALSSQQELDFQKYKDAADALGFELFVKRAKVGESKHVRVRPMFQNWGVDFTIQVTNAALTQEALEEIFYQAGMNSGLCDWRPSSKKSPGPYGRFEAVIKQIG